MTNGEALFWLCGIGVACIMLGALIHDGISGRIGKTMMVFGVINLMPALIRLWIIALFGGA